MAGCGAIYARRSDKVDLESPSAAKASPGSILQDPFGWLVTAGLDRPLFPSQFTQFEPDSLG